jgi:hypothetical protein
VTALYRLLFRLLTRHSERIDRVLFWLYVRLLDEEEFEAWEVAPPEPTNVVHLPRRELH